MSLRALWCKARGGGGRLRHATDIEGKMKRREDIGVWVGVIGIEGKVRGAIGEVVPFLFQYYHLYITH